MARYKHIDTSPRFLAVDLSKQLLPGSFEYALDYLIDHELDISGLDTRYQNGQTPDHCRCPGTRHRQRTGTADTGR